MLQFRTSAKQDQTIPAVLGPPRSQEGNGLFVPSAEATRMGANRQIQHRIESAQQKVFHLPTENADNVLNEDLD